MEHGRDRRRMGTDHRALRSFSLIKKSDTRESGRPPFIVYCFVIFSLVDSLHSSHGRHVPVRDVWSGSPPHGRHGAADRVSSPHGRQTVRVGGGSCSAGEGLLASQRAKYNEAGLRNSSARLPGRVVIISMIVLKDAMGVGWHLPSSFNVKTPVVAPLIRRHIILAVFLFPSTTASTSSTLAVFVAASTATLARANTGNDFASLVSIMLG